VNSKNVGEILTNDLVDTWVASRFCPNKRRVFRTFRRYQGNVVDAMNYVRKLDTCEISEEELIDLKNYIEAVLKVTQLEIASHRAGSWHRSDEWFALYGCCTDTLKA
jgi:hypothetical protein